MDKLTWSTDCADPAVCDTCQGDGYAVVPSDDGDGFVVYVGGMGDLAGYRRIGDGEWIDHFATVEDAKDAAQQHFEERGE